MSFDLFRRPGTVVFLDDDPDYLEMLALVLPRHWHVRLHLRPARCIFDLHREPPLWEIDAWTQQVLVDEWRQGKPLIPQIIDYWAHASDRYSLTHVCVVDFSMPGMDGLQVLSELSDWQGARVLLTGQADEQVAVRAFNRGLIDQFIPKQLPDIAKRLVDAIEQLLETPNPRHAQIWRATLRPEQAARLRKPALQQALQEFASRQWVEHVAIGDPFGILGLDADGNVSWLQLETREGLQALAEAAEFGGVSGAQQEEIRSGRKLVNLELQQALSLPGPCELVQAFAPGGDGSVLAALFQVPGSALARKPAGYNSWLAQQPPRHVIE